MKNANYEKYNKYIERFSSIGIVPAHGASILSDYFDEDPIKMRVDLKIKSRWEGKKKGFSRKSTAYPRIISSLSNADVNLAARYAHMCWQLFCVNNQESIPRQEQTLEFKMSLLQSALNTIQTIGPQFRYQSHRKNDPLLDTPRGPWDTSPIKTAIFKALLMIATGQAPGYLTACCGSMRYVFTEQSEAPKETKCVRCLTLRKRLVKGHGYNKTNQLFTVS